MKPTKTLQAEIIAIGSELLTPFRLDTNSLWLTERLNEIGIEVRLKTILGDDEERLELVIKDALKRSDIVIATGGLGPTEDDITRKAFSRALGRSLVLNEDVLERIRARFASRGIPMLKINERQALVLDGAVVLENQYGSAPGMLIDQDGTLIFLLPGPPNEMKAVFNSEVAPLLENLSGGMRIRRRTLKVSGLTESAVDQKIAPIYKRYSNPQTTILATTTGIEVHLTASGASVDEAEHLLEELANQIEDELGHYVFALQGETLEEVVGRMLMIKRYTLAVAESCTGGLISKRLTDIPGSSRYFLGGVVAYSNRAKAEVLGVPRELIEAHGYASQEVAESCAIHVKERLGSTIGLAVTGIAGPEGGTPEKPVGLVFIALADDVHVESHKLHLPGDRERVRELASQAALHLLRQRLL